MRSAAGHQVADRPAELPEQENPAQRETAQRNGQLAAAGLDELPEFRVHFDASPAGTSFRVIMVTVSPIRRCWSWPIFQYGIRRNSEGQIEVVRLALQHEVDARLAPAQTRNHDVGGQDRRQRRELRQDIPAPRPRG